MKKYLIPILVILLFIMTGNFCRKYNSRDDITIAAYYFPNYHPDKRNEKIHYKGWTEWELVKSARPRFDGHHQPNVPLWGYTDESDPLKMAQKIDAASSHGIDVFIFDWYYYNDGLFLQEGLESGFMKAPNKEKMRFSLMWANHDWLNIHPAKLNEKGKICSPLLYPGKLSLEAWNKMTDYVIDKYFKNESYWLIDGCPYFSVYDITRFIDIFGSVEATIYEIEKFRNKVIAAGFKGLHLNAIVWGKTILPSEEKITDVEDLCAKMGFSSTSSYVWIHHVHLKQFPETPYKYVENEYFKYAENVIKKTSIPYYPNVTMGWDSSPRCAQNTEFKNYGYPCMARISENTPEAFKEALLRMKEFLEKNPKTDRIFNINCWNEWTEGSYLEPDTINGFKYLEAIKDVFNL